MARESGLWTWLKKARLRLAEALHMNRIENSTMSGMPDVEGHLTDAGQFWIELKSKERPARPSTAIDFVVREGQVEFLTKRWRIGGAAWLLVQVGSGAEACRYLVRGDLSRTVQGRVTETWLRENATLFGTKVAPEHFIRRASSRNIGEHI